ncbi:MAG: hypothetical protein HY747_04740 [Elusimicrobia bacterium]|nr:hypothetical protein [Elusimicrobiota bacterium]
MKRKKVVILGSTGSIGQSAEAVLLSAPKGHFCVSLVAASSSVDKLVAQARKLGSSAVYLDDAAKVRGLCNGVRSSFVTCPGHVTNEDLTPLRILDGRGELLGFLAGEPFDICVVALTDFELSCLAMEAMLGRKDRPLNVLVASKEPMVVLGDHFRAIALQNGHHLIPLDSEPSAIFQCLGGSIDAANVKKIYLTASGGPFYRPGVNLKDVTSAMALAHPKWKMGRKITIDSATLVNKALELMEIGNLFDFPVEKIEVAVHPECIVHSMVEMNNGSILAQLGPADMRLPIGYGLLWPDGFKFDGFTRPLGLNDFSRMTFEKPRPGRFPCFDTAMEVAGIGGHGVRSSFVIPASAGGGSAFGGKAGIQINEDLTLWPRLLARSAFLAADEAAVEMFLAGRLKFSEMPALLKNSVNAAQSQFAKINRQAPAKGAEFCLQVYKWTKNKAWSL